MAVEVARQPSPAPRRTSRADFRQRPGIVERGEQTSAVEYLSALAGAEEARGVLEGLRTAADVVLARALSAWRPEGLDFTGRPGHVPPVDTARPAAANVPAHRRSDGLPVGRAVVGVHGDDEHSPSTRRPRSRERSRLETRSSQGGIIMNHDFVNIRREEAGARWRARGGGRRHPQL